MSTSSRSSILTLFVLVGLVACTGGRTGAPTPAPAPTGSAPTATQPAPMPVAPGSAPSPAVQSQITRGVALFAANCAVCHGTRGEGSAGAPGVIGEGTLPLDPPPGARLRRVRFQSAMDLGLFIKNSMPPNGNHLPPQDVACILAWLLQQHGRTPTQPITPATAGAITR